MSVNSQSLREESLVSAWTSSTEVANTGWPNIPTDDQEPLKHHIAEYNRENNKQHLIHPITATMIIFIPLVRE